jgi:hypothetical protein
MVNYKEDTDQNIRTLLFLVLFSFFALGYLDNQGNHYSTSTKFATHYEVVSDGISNHQNAVIFNPVSLPDLQNCKCTLHDTSINPPSFQDNISCYNNRIAQNFITIQQTRLTIKPLLLRKLHYFLSSGEPEELPVLS